MNRGVFLETDNVSRLRNAVDLAENVDKGRPGMVMAYGETGRGKTMAAKNTYAINGGVYVRAWEDWTQAAFLEAICFEVCESRPRAANKSKRLIIEALEERRRSIYVDEADRLSVRRIEDLRDIHDETGAPIILIGELGLPSLIKARGRINDRIPAGYRIKFEGINAQDVSLYALEAAGLNLEAAAAVAVQKQTKGNFRRVHNAVVSLEQMAKAAQTRDIDAAMIRELDLS